MAMQGTSDAHIVQGLIAVLFAIYDGKRLDEILKADAEGIFRRAWAQGTSDAATFERIGLDGEAHPLRRRDDAHRLINTAPGSISGR